MKRILLLTVALAAGSLALPSGASARMIELGAGADAVTPSCPADPCEAAVRVTGYQGRSAGGRKNPYYIRRDGHLIAFTLTLAKPTEEQTDFFDGNFGSPSMVRISVMRRGKTRKTRLNHRLVRQSERFTLDRYFGSRPTFVFDSPIRVRKGNWVAITVPTWAPIFANNLSGSNWWRSSRARRGCDPPESLRQFAMEQPRDLNVFGCTYSGARLLYTVTYVPSNKVTNPED